MAEHETTNLQLPYPSGTGAVKLGAVDFEELAKTLDTVIVQLGLPDLGFGGNTEAFPGKLFIAENAGITLTLPKSETVPSAIIGVVSTAGEIKVKAQGSDKIYGDFVSGAASVALTQWQHLILKSNSLEGQWLIIAGEPKREWTALESLNKVEEVGSPYFSVRARIEVGVTVCRLRGSLKIKTGETLATEERFATLPAGLRPAETVIPSINLNKVANTLVINSSGEMKLGAELGAPNVIRLDGLTFNLT